MYQAGLNDAKDKLKIPDEVLKDLIEDNINRHRR
jgi:hypothetical protein